MKLLDKLPIVTETGKLPSPKIDAQTVAEQAIGAIPLNGMAKEAVNQTVETAKIIKNAVSSNGVDMLGILEKTGLTGHFPVSGGGSFPSMGGVTGGESGLPRFQSAPNMPSGLMKGATAGSGGNGGLPRFQGAPNMPNGLMKGATAGSGGNGGLPRFQSAPNMPSGLMKGATAEEGTIQMPPILTEKRDATYMAPKNRLPQEMEQRIELSEESKILVYRELQEVIKQERVKNLEGSQEREKIELEDKTTNRESTIWMTQKGKIPLENPQRGETTIAAVQVVNVEELLEQKRPSSNLPPSERTIWGRFLNIFKNVEPIKIDINGKYSLFSMIRWLIAAGNNFADEFCTAEVLKGEQSAERIDRRFSEWDQSLKEYISENYPDNSMLKAFFGIDIPEEEMYPEGMVGEELAARLDNIEFASALRGVIVNGLGGDIKSALKFMAQPGESLEELATGLEMIDTNPYIVGAQIGSGIEALENMNVQERGEAVGEIGYVLGTTLATGKGAKNIAKSTKVADGAIDIAKIENIATKAKNVGKKVLPSKKSQLEKGVFYETTMEGEVIDDLYKINVREMVLKQGNSAMEWNVPKAKLNTIELTSQQYEQLFGSVPLEQGLTMLEEQLHTRRKTEYLLAGESHSLRLLEEGGQYSFKSPATSTQMGEQISQVIGNTEKANAADQVPLLTEGTKKAEHISLQVEKAEGAMGKAGVTMSPAVMGKELLMVTKKGVFDLKAAATRQKLRTRVEQMIVENGITQLNQKKWLRWLNVKGDIALAEIEIKQGTATIFQKEYIAHSSIGNLKTAESGNKKLDDMLTKEFGFSKEMPEGERTFKDISYKKVPSERTVNGITIQSEPHLRTYDGEAKVLEHILKDIQEMHLEGKKATIFLYSEKPCCPSCAGIIEKIRERYPNIEIKVMIGKKVYLGKPIKK